MPLSAAAVRRRLVGGYSYLSDDKPRCGTPTSNNVQPRIGATYKLERPSRHPRRHRRLFSAPFQIQGVPGLNNVLNQIGYSRSTPVPVTTDSGLTFGANLSNPVPSGRCCSRSARASA